MTSKLTEKIPGTLIALASAFAFGISLVVNKLGLNGDFNSVQYTVLSLAVAAILSLPLVYKDKKTIINATKETKKRAIIIGILASGIGYLFLFYGQTLTSTINSAFISSLSAFFTIPFAWYFSQDSLTKKQVPGAISILIGLYILVVGLQGLTIQIGDILVLMFAITLGFTNAYSYKPAQEIGGSTLAYLRMIIGFLFLLPIIFFISPITYFSNYWWILSGVLMWFFITGLYLGIQKLGAVKTLMLVVMYPVFSIVASIIVLKETLNMQQIIGGSLLVAGVWWVMKMKSNEVIFSH